ncbi:type IX secretion system protein PorD [Bergeyella sp. RCAD1439]|uniref:type IX secretion system protein PorD n=1 Tax=Bergeyella anatis TaxID=3113737 RepID=UPI002E1833CB|nr:DUF4835 family protein [Bergeyella sp. RCAD1439]
MKKLLLLLSFTLLSYTIHAQELLAGVSVNHQQMGGSNVQVYQTLEKSLKNFINNTSWTGKNLQNFEKIKCNFSIIINSREGNNRFKSSIVVQAVRPVFNSTYETPLLNINDTNFEFEYNENENLVFNERQFSGKNLIDVVSFYIYMILGYDADSFSQNGGQQWFQTAQKIAQNSQNQRFGGWAITEGPRSRANLIDNLLKQDSKILRSTFYAYHRNGLDNLHNANQSSAKRVIGQSLLNLKYYENNFQLNYPFNLFIETKRNEIYDIFANGANTEVNISELRNLMNIFSPKDAETKWNKWK